MSVKTISILLDKAFLNIESIYFSTFFIDCNLEEIGSVFALKESLGLMKYIREFFSLMVEYTKKTS